MSGTGTVWAILCRRLGGPADLALDRITPPTPGNGEVLIDVRAAGVRRVAPGDRVPALLDWGGYAEAALARGA